MEITGVTYSTAHYEHYNQNGDRNYFEEIIDAMILDEIAGMNETFRAAISNLSKDKKRMTILSLLEKDIKLFNKIKALVDKDINKMDHIKDVVLMLREYVKIAEVEKKKYGEVMTSLDLVKEMLNTLPIDVWSNPNLKWLDPANGTGPYPIAVIGKLMKGLKDWQPDDEKRYKHIVENMIYVCELQPKNMFLYMCAVDPFDAYKLNIYTGSFLEKEFDYHMKNVWNVDKFDIILGNPPYNSGGTGTGNTIWHLFVEKSDILSRRYITFVHPSAWRMPLREGDRFYKSSKVIKNSKIVHMLSKSDSVKYFGLVVKVDYYLIDKEFNGPCYIKSSNSEINMNIKELQFIPNDNFDLFKSLISSNDKCKVVFSYAYDPRNKFISRTQEEGYNYTLVHTTPKGGNRFVYSSRNDKGHFGIPKVIFGDSGIYDVVIDMNGDYGMTQHAIGIEVSDLNTAQLIKKALMSDKFSKFLESVSYSNFQIDWRIFTQLKNDFYLDFL
jgi:hypothetical protein